nr:unnamed protein product [Callosobruchus analis]
MVLELLEFPQLLWGTRRKTWTNSIVLLALVDPKYRFLVIDVGSYGKNSDGGIFENSILGKLIQEES